MKMSACLDCAVKKKACVRTSKLDLKNAFTTNRLCGVRHLVLILTLEWAKFTSIHKESSWILNICNFC